MISKFIKKINIWNNFFNKKEQILLLIILLSGFFNRLITAVKTQLWRDEVYIFLTSQNNSFFNLLLQKHWDTAHPPLYFIFLHFWGRYFYKPFLLRLPSLIIAFFILYLTPILAKKIDQKNIYFPFLTLFFISFSHFQNSLSMVARPYPFEIFFTLVSLILFIKILNSNFKTNWQTSLFWGITTSLAFLFDYGVLWFIIGQFIFLLILSFIKRFKNIKKFFSSLLMGVNLIFLSLSLTLPLIMVNLQNSFHLERYLAASFFENPIFHINNQLSNLLGITYKDIFLNWGIKKDYLIVFFILINFLGFLFLYLRDKKVALMLLITQLSIFIFPLLVSFFIYPIFLDRHINIFNLFFIIFISYFFSFLLSLNKKLVLVVFLTIIISVINFYIAFPQIHYVDPPYDFLSLHKKIFFYSKKNKKIVVLTHAPLFMFKHFNYYNLFYRINNFIVIQISDKNLNIIKKTFLDNKQNKVFYIDFLYEKNHGNQYLPSNFDFKINLSCKKILRNYIDYIYFIECSN